jgi:2-methylaconitate cis-trans-isomerase PrpF
VTVESQQTAMRCVIVRGGPSRGPYCHAGFARTARRLMDGVAYVPREPA